MNKPTHEQISKCAKEIYDHCATRMHFTDSVVKKWQTLLSAINQARKEQV